MSETIDSLLSYPNLVKKLGQSKILFVDDEPNNLRVLINLLKEENFVQYVARSGEEAITMAKEHSPDLILLDVNMPKMNGFETLEHLQKEDKTRNIPVIFLTAESDFDKVIKGLKLGSVDYIRKPFETDELKARVKNHIKLRLYQKYIINSYSDISGLLGNINQSVFCINQDGIIQPPVSEYSNYIFEEKIEGASLYEKIFKDLNLSPTKLNELKKNLNECFEHSKVNWNSTRMSFPKKISYKNKKDVEKILEVKYIPLWKKEKLIKIMITLEDITSKEQFSKNKNFYNLGQISSIAGIKKNTLKTWIQRYGLYSKTKDSHGNFIYSEEECERFQIYGSLIGRGSKIGYLITLSDKELKELASRLNIEKDDNHLKTSSSLTDIIKNLLFFIKNKNFSVFFYELNKLKNLYEEKQLVYNIFVPLHLEIKKEKMLTQSEHDVYIHYFSETLKEALYYFKNKRLEKKEIKILVAKIFDEPSLTFWMAALLVSSYHLEISLIDSNLVNKEDVIRDIAPNIICLVLSENKKDLQFPPLLKTPLMTNYSKEEKLLILGEESQRNENMKSNLNIIHNLKSLNKILDDKIKNFN
jgi:CheY-like chemotaxis protein